MTVTTLQEAVDAHPFDDYQEWWPMSTDFVAMMHHAIVQEAREQSRDTTIVQSYVEEYIRTVYHRGAAPDLLARVRTPQENRPLMSGEFDAFSYAHFRHVFEVVAADPAVEDKNAARRRFTRGVGRRFFRQMEEHLQLDIPEQLATTDDLARLTHTLDRIGAFLLEQGYLRDHFAFRFDVDLDYAGAHIAQSIGDLLPRLAADQPAFALYEMGYPVILPSAVYLYQTKGEAQHHSSRTIEQLFDQIGYVARETDDFDPTGFPSDLVVELWTIAADGVTQS